ncbi:glycoside hydrolase N-terminal domain-containing protein [Paenibacillus aurantius]|uniref:Glycoside hydrolase N-terminal domain-containing protein n=1 Tax=Paenibacillus aurantius TaxID=2918900 RepID=A0AA96RGQ9_9BACL|nr:glycoside hydrolase N-terminal domain-containing protein [Paenibacillus aurantius]WNQ13302.1 glycoside hydrolase N-terminal domain-containing protein [Paenibacillus aurantius]
MKPHREGRWEDKVTLRYPASWWRNLWREALPAGNGVLGASVFGGVQDETVLLNHAGLWHWGQRDELPDVSFTLKETRRLMDEKRYLEASWQLADALKERGYGTKLASRFPLAAIRLTMPGEQAFRSYRRELDMDSGQITVAWKDGEHRYSRVLFVSRADDCLVYRIGEAGGKGVSGEIGLELHPSDRWADTPEFRELESTVETGAEGPYAWYAAANDDGTDFGAVMLLLPEGGSCTPAAGRLRFERADRVLVLVKVFAAGSREADWKRLKEELAGLIRPTGSAEGGEAFQEESAGGHFSSLYEHLLERHTAQHRPLYRSASLELGGEEEERTSEQWLADAYEGEAPPAFIRKLWAYGRYLFLSGTSTAEEAGPFGLYGLWGGDYRLVWSHHMANENIQMMYWHAHQGGLSELVLPLFRYYESLMDDFRGNARKLYGCGGIYIPAGTTAGVGVPNQIVPVILNWTGAAGWLARHFEEYARFTEEEGFREERAFPFMREVLAFYKDFLVQEENGQYKLYPSVSPENTPLNHMPADGKPLAHPMPTTINATMDVAIVKELLRNLIRAGRASGCREEELAEWRAMLERLPAYRINDEGAAAEWIHPDFEDRYAHRHLSHLYPVFPGDEISRESDPEAFQSFAKAVDKRELGAQTGWSLAHMAAIYARLGDGDRSLECLDVLARTCLLPNLFTLHNDWRGMGASLPMPTAPVQLDASLGWVNAVQEMLLQVQPGMIKLLPALPDRLAKGKLADWRFYTGRLSLEWDTAAGIFLAELTAERDTETTVKLPGGFPPFTWSGEGIEPSPLGGSFYVVKMKRGEKVQVQACQGSFST